MEVIIQSSPDEVGRLAARKVASTFSSSRTRCSAWPPGRHRWRSTPNWPARSRGTAPSTRAGSACFALDEYVGIPEDHPESYASVLRREFVEPLGLEPSAVALPDGRAADLAAACAAYEAAIRDAGGVDLQILGIGANGHIGFNEPTSSFASRTRLKTLALQTRADNARFFDRTRRGARRTASPRGSARSCDARELLLVAQGDGEGRGGRRRRRGTGDGHLSPARSCSSTSTPR